MGRVESIDADQIKLEHGSLDYGPKTLFIDCTADGLARRAPEAVFTDGKITLQAVRTCQQVFSAAFIAHIELTEHDQARQNQLCTDYMHNMLADLINGMAWQEDPTLMTWMKASRLDGFSSAATSAEADTAFMQRLQEQGMVAAGKLMEYLS
jgi:hypothetical protein